VRDEVLTEAAARGNSNSSRQTKLNGQNQKHFGFKNKQNEPLIQKLLEN